VKTGAWGRVSKNSSEPAGFPNPAAGGKSRLAAIAGGETKGKGLRGLRVEPGRGFAEQSEAKIAFSRESAFVDFWQDKSRRKI
jgi:hypothetical protein